MHTNNGTDSYEKFHSARSISTFAEIQGSRVIISLCRLITPPGEKFAIQPRRSSLWVSFAAFVFLCLTLLVVAAVLAGRTDTLPELLDPPDRYLPGNPFPRDVACYVPSDEHLLCFVHILGREVYFNYDAGLRKITHTGIRLRGYTLGKLIALWGAPEGIIRSADTDAIYMCWGRRFALVYARSLRPDNQVEYIVYDPELPQASPWHGFADRQS